MSLLVVAVLLGFQGQPDADLMALKSQILSGESKLTIGGAIPGKVVAFGDRAVVLAVAKDGKSTSPAIVAATFGKGRVAAFGHGGMLQTKGSGDAIGKLLMWLGKGNSKIGGFGQGSQGLAGFAPVRLQRGSLDADLKTVGLIVAGSRELGDREMGPKIRSYVESGGGLLVVETPWGWKQLNPGKSLATDFASNEFLAPMGIGFADGMLDKSGGDLQLVAPIATHHAREALRVFESAGSGRTDNGAIVTDVLTSVLRDGYELGAFAEEVWSAVKVAARSGFPVKGKPVLASDFRSRLGMVAFDLEWRKLPVNRILAHPAAKDFPGDVAGFEKPETAVVDVEAGVRRWRSTGRYAAPGARILVQVGGAIAAKKMSLRIGGHKDQNWQLDKWERFPSIDLEVPIVNGVAEGANPFGGLIYLVCNENLPVSSVKIEGAVQAPVYILGSTTDSEWKQIRRSGAPWGEVIGKQSGICVPSEVLRDLDDPKAVAEYFDEMVREAEKLYAVAPRTTEHRYQADRQIVAGYMHAGYPIMTWLDVTEKFVDIKVLRGNDGGPLWGFYHELGHNYQRGEWTWDGWGETTNNLFSVYGGIYFNGQEVGHGAMEESNVQERLVEVKAKPGSEDYYKKDPWYGLTFWEMLRREFGFVKFTEFFAWASDKRIGGDQARKDAFLVEMSRILGRDLTRYCEMWGVKFSADAKAKVNGYPEWMPKEWR